ncbi:MAG: hypothetical protein OXH45_12765 [Gammaproteobacteria bacterium]|nr:hypothetical protein [Gammaproteobacteria bacterium]
MIAGHELLIQGLRHEYQRQVPLVQRRQGFDQFLNTFDAVGFNEAHDIVGRKLFRQRLGVAGLHKETSQHQRPGRIGSRKTRLHHFNVDWPAPRKPTYPRTA